jgi:hypothetical protein
MSIKRVVLVVLVASAVMLAVGVAPRLAGNAYALPPVQEPDPTGVTIPYPGRLAADAGQPVALPCTMPKPAGNRCGRRCRKM